jgi:hypothetical protein
MTIQSPILSKILGVTHGFGTLGEPIPLSLKEMWERSRPFHKQVHGVQLGRVTAVGQELGEVDAMYTQAPGCPIGIMTADCVPSSLLTNPDRALRPSMPDGEALVRIF